MNSASDWLKPPKAGRQSFRYPTSLQEDFMANFKSTGGASGSDVLLERIDCSSLSEKEFIELLKSSRYAAHGVVVTAVRESSKSHVVPLALPKSLLPRLRQFITRLPAKKVERSPLCYALLAISDAKAGLDCSALVSDSQGCSMRVEAVFHALRAIMVCRIRFTLPPRSRSQTFGDAREAMSHDSASSTNAERHLYPKIIHPLFTDLVDAWQGCDVGVFEMPSLDGCLVPAAQCMYQGTTAWPVQEIEDKWEQVASCEYMCAYAEKAKEQFQWRIQHALRLSRLLTFVQYDRKSKTLHVAYIRFLPVIKSTTKEIIGFEARIVFETSLVLQSAIQNTWGDAFPTLLSALQILSLQSTVATWCLQPWPLVDHRYLKIAVPSLWRPIARSPRMSDLWEGDIYQASGTCNMPIRSGSDGTLPSQPPDAIRAEMLDVLRRVVQRCGSTLNRDIDVCILRAGGEWVTYVYTTEDLKFCSVIKASLSELASSGAKEVAVYTLLAKFDKTAVPQLLHHHIQTQAYLLVTEMGIPLDFRGPNASVLRHWYEWVGGARYVVRRMLYLVLLLHSLGVVHGDIKPTNLVVLLEGQLGLIDFGGSAISPADRETDVERALNGFTVSRKDITSITRDYHHPPLAQSTNTTVPSTIDVYSVGKTLLALATMFLPFEGGDILSRAGALCTQEDLTLRDVLQHPAIECVDIEDEVRKVVICDAPQAAVDNPPLTAKSKVAAATTQLPPSMPPPPPTAADVAEAAATETEKAVEQKTQRKQRKQKKQRKLLQRAQVCPLISRRICR